MNSRGIGDLNRNIIIERKKVARGMNGTLIKFLYLCFTLMPVG